MDEETAVITFNYMNKGISVDLRIPLDISKIAI